MVSRLLAKSLIAGALLLSNPAFASLKQTPVAQAEEDAFEAEFPFDPPLDRPIRFRAEETKERNGQQVTSSVVSRLTFSKDGEGYVVRVETLEANVGMDAALPPELKAVLDKLSKEPIIIDISADAEIVGMRDADAYWKTIIDFAEAAVIQGAQAEGKPTNPEGEKAARSIMTAFRDMPPEARLAMLTKHVQPIIEFANTSLASDEVIESEVESTTPFGPIVQKVRIKLTEADQDAGTVQMTSNVPQEELVKLTGNLLDRVGDAAGMSLGKEEILKELKAFALNDSATYRVSRQDGLLLGLTFERRGDIAASDKEKRIRESLKIDRLD